MIFRFVRWLRRRGLSREKLRASWLHRLLGDRMFGRELWAFRREPLARGWLIGCIMGTLPLPGLQLLLGVPIALWCRANLLVAVGLILTTNPLTAGIFYPFAFLVGCAALGRPASDFHWDNAPLWKAGGPLLLGCVLIGVLAGLTGYLAFRLLWPVRGRLAAKTS